MLNILIYSKPIITHIFADDTYLIVSSKYFYILLTLL